MNSTMQMTQYPLRFRLCSWVRDAVTCFALLASAGIATVSLSGGTVLAQQVQRIAAVVNDEVISIHDVTERIDFVIVSSGLPKTLEQRQRLAPQVLRRLIDETLQAQEAKRLNIQVGKRDLDAAVASIEQSNGIPKGKFADFLAQQNVSMPAVMSQIEADLAWQKLLSRRVVPAIDIGEEEIDAVIARINATKGAEQFRVSEILLTIDDPSEQVQVSELAARLVEQLRGGAEFAAVARQFSKSATAATGGDIGWIQEGQLDNRVIDILKKLEPGGVSDATETPDGMVVYRLDDKRKSAAPGEDDREIALRQILVQLDRATSDADATVRMQQVSQLVSTAEGCPAFGTPRAFVPAT